MDATATNPDRCGPPALNRRGGDGHAGGHKGRPYIRTRNAICNPSRGGACPHPYLRTHDTIRIPE